MKRLVFIVALGLAVTLVAACHPESDYVHPCPPSSSEGGDFVQRSQRYLIQKVRNYRVNHGLNDLYCNLYAQAKAQDWAEFRARNGGLNHSTLENGYPTSGQWGHRYWCWLGENVGSVGYDQGEAVNSALDSIFGAWTASASHRDIMLDGRAEWVGAGWASGGGRIYAVLEMGTREGSPRCGLQGSSVSASGASDGSSASTVP